MRTKSATEQINDQIAREIAKLNSIFTDEDEKPAIVQRIADLKAMVSDTPQVTVKPEQPTTRELIAEFIGAIRNR
jgi:Flp pilus assembly CpaE family ATPase